MQKRIVLEFTEYYAPDGEIYHFDSHDKFLLSETGLGMPPITHLSYRSPLQHGETVYDFRLQPRIIQMVIRSNSCDRIDYWSNRANILNLLRPNRFQTTFELGTLRKVQPDGTKRDIDVALLLGPAFAERELDKWDEWAFTETIRFYAPDPTFYDPTTNTSAWSLSMTENLVFPFEGPFMFGEAATPIMFINYNGTWPAYPTITLQGPMSGCEIKNVSIDEKIKLNYTIMTGETVTVSLTHGRQTVESDYYGNIIGVISDDSDLSTFRIAPEPDAPNGQNRLELLAAGTLDGVSQAYINYQTRYIGI